MTTKKKLLKLADFLEHKVKNSWFDMLSWADKGFPQKECGTTACAAGWATVCFPKSGLTLLNIRGGNSYLQIAYKREGRKTLKGMSACKTFFEIDEKVAEHLFHPEEYSERRGRMSVVRRLRTVANKME